MALLVIAGTVAVANGSANVTFSQAQTIPAGVGLIFSSQPGTTYMLNAALSAATAGVLSFPYNGTTNAAATTTVARQIILLDVAIVPGPLFKATAVFWLVPQPQRVIPLPGFTSQVPQLSAAPVWGATAAELAALQSGTTVERIDTTGQALSPAGLETLLAARYGQCQTALTAQGSLGAKLIGDEYDGVSWTRPP